MTTEELLWNANFESKPEPEKEEREPYHHCKSLLDQYQDFKSKKTNIIITNGR